MSGLVLLRPWWLLALPVVAALAVLLWRRRARLGDWERVVRPEMMAALRRLGHVEAGRQGVQGLGALAAAGLVALALTGPATTRREAAAFRNLDGVILVLDASLSMTEADGWSQMLTAGRAAMAGLGARPAALVVVAGDAYHAADLTSDHKELAQTWQLVDGATVPDRGSRPWLGLARAADVLKEARLFSADVVLFTDGGGLGPETLEVAAKLEAEGARLSVVAAEGLEPAEVLARAGGGRTFTPLEGVALAGFLAEGGRAQLERADYPLLFLADHGRLVLLAALVPLLLGFRRRQS
ncbi:vWA domain-containing protein [Vannielia litorea]|uniref:vWA domain-containing protein n=1 Tax=Vannielia litorea TaxID=1217970 RepID=UPI001C98C248|nr:VWA domain-containing protein [Vannielia litorea]MBY6047202.1 VWA domain-containing protein [Vannielia litorea]MBY6074616.1 VWA domain-containing protein [Vannielia litorea]